MDDKYNISISNITINPYLESFLEEDLIRKYSNNEYELYFIPYNNQDFNLSWIAAVTKATPGPNQDPFYWLHVFLGNDSIILDEKHKRYLGKPKEFLDKVINKMGHRIPHEMLGQSTILIPGSKALLCYGIWPHINIYNNYGVGLERSLRWTSPKDEYLMPTNFEEFLKEANELYDYMVESGISHEEARRVLPVGVMTYGVYTFNPRYMSRIANALKSFSIEEFKEVGSLLEAIVKDVGVFSDEEFKAKQICWDTPIVKRVKYDMVQRDDENVKLTTSFITFYQLGRNRRVSLDNIKLYPAWLPSPEIVENQELFEKFILLEEKWRELREQAKFDLESIVYSSTYGQVLSYSLNTYNDAAQEIHKIRNCMSAQHEIRSLWEEIRRKMIFGDLPLRCGPECRELTRKRTKGRCVKQRKETTEYGIDFYERQLRQSFERAYRF